MTLVEQEKLIYSLTSLVSYSAGFELVFKIIIFRWLNLEEYLASFWASLSLPCGMELATCTQLLKLQTCFVPRCVTQSNSWVKEYTLYFPFLSALVALHLSSVAHSLTRLYFLAGVTSLFLDQPSFECE